MKRIKCFMLLCAFVLALTGSAWAEDTYSALSKDVLSFDVAKTLAISVDISFDVYKTSFDAGSQDIFEIHLSPDKSVDQSIKLVVKTSGDLAEVASFTSSDKIGLFVLRSADSYSDYVSINALRLSEDTGSGDLFVAFPIVLFEKGMSGDVSAVSGDTGITELKITQHYSDDLGVLSLATSGDNSGSLKLTRLSGDAYEVVTSADSKITAASKDFSTITDLALVAVSGSTTDAYIDIKLSGDGTPTSKDLVMIKMVYSGDDVVTNYGVFYSQDASLDIVSADRVRISPMAISVDDYPTLTVKIYNASADAISPTMTFKRYLMANNTLTVSFDVSGDVVSKSVTFADPSSWLVSVPAEASFDKTSFDEISNVSFDKIEWYVSRDIPAKWVSSDIITNNTLIFASFDKKSAEEEQEDTDSGDFTVTVSPSSFDLKAGASKDITATLSKDVTGAKYVWYQPTSATKGSTDTIVSSPDKTYTVTSTSADKVGSKKYFYVKVNSGDTLLASSDVVVVTIISADSTPGGETPGDTGKVLSTLEVKISPDLGNTEEYAVKVGTADTIDLSLTVLATYSGDTTATDVTSTLGAKATWTLGTVSPTTTVFSLKNDSGATNTLNIASAITEGTYTVPVSVKVTSGDVSDDATVTYTIVASKSGGSGGGTPDSGDVTSGDVTKEDAKEAVTEALKGKTNPSVTDLLGSTAAITAISKTVSSTGELDMSVLNGVTSLEGLATLLTNLGNVKSLNFADMGDSLTKIDNLKDVKLDSISLAGNTYITTVDLSGAQIPVVNAKGSSALTSVNVAGNTSIASLDIGETKVASLDVAGCTNLQDLEVDNSGTTGQGSLEELNIEGCVSLKNLTLTKNKLLGIKKPTGLKNTVAIKARNQRRPHTFTSASFNFWTFLWQTILGKTTAFSATTATFEPTRITVITYTVGTTTTSTDVPASGDVTLSGTPTGIAYEYDTSGFGPSTGSSLQSASVVAADDTGMDVTLGTVGSSSGGSTDDEESPTLGSSGGGCDAGFGLGALSAVMLMFALIKKRS